MLAVMAFNVQEGQLRPGLSECNWQCLSPVLFTSMQSAAELQAAGGGKRAAAVQHPL